MFPYFRTNITLCFGGDLCPPLAQRLNSLGILGKCVIDEMLQCQKCQESLPESRRHLPTLHAHTLTFSTSAADNVSSAKSCISPVWLGLWSAVAADKARRYSGASWCWLFIPLVPSTSVLFYLPPPATPPNSYPTPPHPHRLSVWICCAANSWHLTAETVTSSDSQSYCCSRWRPRRGREIICFKKGVSKLQPAGHLRPNNWFLRGLRLVSEFGIKANELVTQCWASGRNYKGWTNVFMIHCKSREEPWKHHQLMWFSTSADIEKLRKILREIISDKDVHEPPTVFTCLCMSLHWGGNSHFCVLKYCWNIRPSDVPIINPSVVPEMNFRSWVKSQMVCRFCSLVFLKLKSIFKVLMWYM